MREVHCDFCNAVLSDHGWDCPARDFDYGEQRVGLGADAIPIDGSIGSWLACDECARCVRDGLRRTLLDRTLVGNYGTAFVAAVRRVDVRDLHDQFWANRTGKPTWIGGEQLALIASDPALLREEKL